MERALVSTLAHVDHPIAAPLSDGSVRTLLDRALPRGNERVLDLGCAEAAWMVRALTGHPGLRATGSTSASQPWPRGARPPTRQASATG